MHCFCCLLFFDFSRKKLLLVIEDLQIKKIVPNAVGSIHVYSGEAGCSAGFSRTRLDYGGVAVSGEWTCTLCCIAL